MGEFEKQKYTVINGLKALCAHCTNNVPHNCKLNPIVSEVSGLAGVPLIVNDRFKGMFFSN